MSPGISGEFARILGEASFRYDTRVDPSQIARASGAGSPTAPLRLDPAERQAVGALASIYAARMLGLFLLLPVLALYAGGLAGASPLLVGLALGAYGLTQAVFQIPFGMLSDRYGRRRVIASGLVLYGVGSVCGALATGIWGVIVARMVQGSGAVSGPVTALLADLTRPAVRTRSMALIGISIGASFMVSLVAAPLLEPLIGVSGIFWIMAGLAALCLLLLALVVPRPPVVERRASVTAALRGGFTADLAPYYVGVFALNFVLTAAFLGVPHALRDVLGVNVHDHWKTYLWVFVASLPPTVPLVVYTERSAEPAKVLRFGVGILVAALLALALTYRSYWAMCGSLVAFFAAFNFLEARLPARLSQAAPQAIRGAALGIFATTQFLGAFAGGIAGGALYGSPLGLTGVFIGAAGVTLVWLLLPLRRLD
jgi:predicted MFS family arabinose efflux permease